MRKDCWNDKQNDINSSDLIKLIAVSLKVTLQCGQKVLIQTHHSKSTDECTVTITQAHPTTRPSPFYDPHPTMYKKKQKKERGRGGSFLPLLWHTSPLSFLIQGNRWKQRPFVYKEKKKTQKGQPNAHISSRLHINILSHANKAALWPFNYIYSFSPPTPPK